MDWKLFKAPLGVKIIYLMFMMLLEKIHDIMLNIYQLKKHLNVMAPQLLLIFKLKKQKKWECLKNFFSKNSWFHLI